MQLPIMQLDRDEQDYAQIVERWRNNYLFFRPYKLPIKRPTPNTTVYYDYIEWEDSK